MARQDGIYAQKVSYSDCKMKKVVIPKILRSFIDDQFRKMAQREEELRSKRTLERPKLKKVEQKEQKRRKRKGVSNGASHIPTTDARFLKGKDFWDFNNFVYICYHLLKKEPRNADNLGLGFLHGQDFHSWISRYLERKGYRKKNQRSYNKNDIKRILNSRFEDSSEVLKSSRDTGYLPSFVDYLYDEYCKREPANDDPS